MADPVTIRESLSILWLLFFIRFDVSFAIINKDTYFSGIDRLTLLNPNNLSIAICGHHAVSGNPNAKLCTGRNGILGYTYHFKISFIQERTCTCRCCQITYRHVHIDNTAFKSTLLRYILKA